MATVRFSRGHWVADYYDTNKRRRIERPRGHFENLTSELRAAQALLADRVAEVADGLVHEGSGTFEDAAIRWLNSKVAIRPSTRRIYQQLLVGYLIPYFGDRTLRLIRVTDIERFRAELNTGIPDSIRQALNARVMTARPGHAEARAKQRSTRVRISTRSINKALCVLSMVFNYAMRNQWVARNPARYVEPARDPRPLEERPLDMDVLTPAEVAALRDAATTATCRDGKLVTNNYRLLISFAVFTGCRAGEILGAGWNHIDWESGEFRVRRAYREGHFHEPKTRTSYRSIALPGFLLKELGAWRSLCPQSLHDLIFPNLDGRPMSYTNLMARGFHPALKRAGIRRIRFHDLRHTYASLMISNGEDIVRVSRLMGHANASFTFNTYCHMLPRKRDPVGDRLASLVFGNKMETDRDAANRARKSVSENIYESMC
ncbi:MAG: site-specific integrase [Gammaproteobacteria bacterium]|nr:site-specific integrase [Gammaproteobacteria bacterium]